jgi:hypothetical protein
MTDSEQALWARLRGKQLKGIQFYRQRPIGNAIVDFYAPKAKLVVEVDGAQHFTPGNNKRSPQQVYGVFRGTKDLKIPLTPFAKGGTYLDTGFTPVNARSCGWSDNSTCSKTPPIVVTRVKPASRGT